MVNDNRIPPIRAEFAGAPEAIRGKLDKEWDGAWQMGGVFDAYWLELGALVHATGTRSRHWRGPTDVLMAVGFITASLLCELIAERVGKEAAFQTLRDDPVWSTQVPRLLRRPARKDAPGAKAARDASIGALLEGDIGRGHFITLYGPWAAVMEPGSAEAWDYSSTRTVEDLKRFGGFVI